MLIKLQFNDIGVVFSYGEASKFQVLPLLRCSFFQLSEKALRQVWLSIMNDPLLRVGTKNMEWNQKVAHEFQSMEMNDYQLLLLSLIFN